MKKQKNKEELLEEGKEICPECGNELIEEDGVKVCPRCDGQIDFFGDDDE